ncbi:glycosyltransferase family 4 protein [Lactonifactor longoviformis]|uniref:glycosyltransferase family 4 protein n=1 Tax=Lactonifactor longoviformis TaxID=341220 RepID=UPI0036F3B762
MEKIRLLLVAPVPPPYGGIGNWVLLMKKYLAEKKEVELVDIINIAPKERGLDGRTLYERVIGQGMKMLRLRRQMKKVIQKKKPTVVHITTSGQLAIIRDILFLKSLKKDGIYTVYHIRFGRIPEIFRKNTAEWKLLKKALKLASKTIAIDSETKKVLEEEVGYGQVSLVANPFVTKNTEKYLNVKPSKTVIFLGWCVKTKGIEELLSAWIHIEQRYPGWTLKLVGPYDSSYKEALEQKYVSKNIVFVGEKEHEDALDILSKSEVFILPSYTEGFPNAVLEAMALGKPIIATEVGAIAEMLSNKSGIVIQPQDTKAVEAALTKVLDDGELRKELGTNAYHRIRKQYDIDVIYNKYLSVWRGETVL